MILSSVTYLVFLTVCLALHDLLPGKYRNFWLLLASVGFFIYAMPAQALIMLLFCLAVYGMGPAVASDREKGKKVWLVLGICVCVGFLVFYKYLGFLAELLKIPSGQDSFKLAVPMGISYVTFQCISYLVEIHKGRMKPEASPVDFLVYCLFFPKLTAGPIEQPALFLAQLKQERRCTARDALDGILRITMGFVKKIVVADYLAAGVNAVFAPGTARTGWSVVLAMVMYTIQILWDFSGYTDIARGSAALFGIRLTENFHSPYSAVNIRDFWRRWHISLSTWLRNYIYIPLGGSRVHPLRRYLNVTVTFLVSGIWHGASWTFVFWGLLHGIYQVLEILLEPVGKSLRERMPISGDSFLWRLLARGWTLTLVAVSFLFFRADSISTAFSMLGTLLGSWGSLAEAMALCRLDWTAVLLTVAGMLFTGQMEKFLGSGEKPSRGMLLYICAGAVWAVFLVYMVCAASGSVSSFIYFEF